MMAFTNDLTQAEKIPQEILLKFLKLLSPYAPHLSEELWSKCGQDKLIAEESWPNFEPKLCEESEITIVLQVNGKKRGECQVSKDAQKDEIEKLAFENENVKKHTNGKTVRKVIVVPRKLVNIVAH
jgi:leucyl-tRNA synthetase